MLQLASLRNDVTLVKERLAVKNFKELELVDQIISIDDERKKLTFQYDDTKAKINAASKEIGMLMAKGEKEAAETKKKDVENFKNNLAPIEVKLAEAEKQLNELLVRLPNLPSEKVPKGKHRKTMKWCAQEVQNLNYSKEQFLTGNSLKNLI